MVKASILIGALCFLAGSVFAEDRILSLTVQGKLGYDEIPVVRVEVDLKRARDLHVSFQTWGDFKPIKRTMRRIPESGKYHFEVPFDNLKSGRYRVAAYLTPRGKDWNNRLGETSHASMEVVDTPTLVQEALFGDEDRVSFVDWPKEVAGDEEVTLKILYELTEPRELIVRLANSENWKQHGEVVVTVTEPGEVTIPLANLTSDFPAGNYAWIVFLAEPGSNEAISEKYGKHFVLTAQ